MKHSISHIIEKMTVITLGGKMMASKKEYLDFILEQLSELEDISYKAMMKKINHLPKAKKKK